MKRFYSLVLVLVLSFFVNIQNAFAATIFSDTFGTGSTTSGVPGWIDGGNMGVDSEAKNPPNGNNNDSVSPSGGRFAKILGEAGFICRAIDTTGYTGVNLSYEWRGDNDAESSDHGIVEIKPASGNNCNDNNGWTNLQTHNLSIDNSWSVQSAFTHAGMQNTNFLLRFRVNSNQNNEDFRVDNVVLSGNAVPVVGSITVFKNVLNPEGTEVNDTQMFAVTIDGTNTQSISEVSSYTYSNLSAGLYTLDEVNNPDYDFYAFSIDEDLNGPGAQVTVVAGMNTNLTITNKQKQGTITVNKVVTNPNGGTAVAGDFSFSVNGGSAIQFIQDLGNSLFGSNTFNWHPGTVSISEVLPNGSYAISYSGCNFVLVSNGNNTCTITNSDIPEGQGAITVVKNVVNDNGGTKTVSDFSLYIDETMVTSGQANFLAPGEYTISEGSLPSGYTQTSLVCSNGETTTGGTINLTEQSAWTCVITNDDQPAHLTITKQTINNALNGTQDGEFTFNLSSQEAPIVLVTAEGMASTTFELNAGSYTLSEVVPAGWTLTSISCESEGDEVVDGVNLSLSNGQNLNCTFTNTRQMGSVKITKIIEQGDGSKEVSDFMIHISQNNEEVSGSPKAGNAEGVVYGPYVVGAYKVFENNVIENGVGYAPHYYGDCDSFGVINILDGETLECTVTNTRFVHSGGGAVGGQVLGEQTETTSTEPTPKDAPVGQVLGEQTEIVSDSCGAYLNKYMFWKRLNDKEEVKKLQVFLNEHMNANLVVDGVYGAATRASVKAFQEKYPAEVLAPWGLVSGTGNVFKTTLRWVNMLKCSTLDLPMPSLR